MTNELSGVVGPTGSDAIKQMLDAAGTVQPEGWAGLVGLAVLLFAAAGFVVIPEVMPKLMSVFALRDTTS